MAAFVLLIIVICGHLFVERRPFSRFKQTKSSGWDAYFHVGAWGVLFATISTAVVLLVACIIDWFGYGPIKDTKHLSPILEQALSLELLTLFWWSMISCLLGWGSGWYLNSSKNIQYALANVALDDEFEKILYVSMAETAPVQVTAKSRKVYIGFAMTQITKDDFSKREYISLLPLLSGYREKDTLQIKLVNDYHEFYANIDSINLSQFKIVIPVSEITSIAFFDVNAHSYISKEESLIIDEPVKELLESL